MQTTEEQAEFINQHRNSLLRCFSWFIPFGGSELGQWKDELLLRKAELTTPHLRPLAAEAERIGVLTYHPTHDVYSVGDPDLRKAIAQYCAANSKIRLSL